MSLRGTLALLLCLFFAADGIRGAKTGRAQEIRGDNSINVHKGKFTLKDKAQRCTWVARGVDEYTMNVTCKRGKGHGFTCKYTAKPVTCNEYSSNPGGYWKQISRSLQKHTKLCDPSAMIRARMCQLAPLDAHFKLAEASRAKHSKKEKTPMTTNTTPPDTKRQCTKRADHSEIAKERCGDSWASLCAFLFTMIQSEDC